MDINLPKFYYINLDRSNDRLKHMTKFFKKMESMEGVRLPGQRRHNNRKDKGPRNINKQLIEKIQSLTPLIETRVKAIKLIATVAPLLGLLGTVIGMIETFQAITLFGTGDPKLMAGGISQALVTTMLGLIVAAPLLFLHSYAENYSKSIIGFLEEKASGIVAMSIKK